MTYSVGIDIGGTNIRTALIKSDEVTATIVKEERALVPENKSPANVVRLVKEMVSDFDAPYKNIGVGFAGMIDNQGVVRNAPAFGWKEVPLQSMLSTELGRHVGLCNDLNAICLGEYNFGAGRKYSNVLCVYVGTGIGAAAVLEDYLYEGHSGVAFELGHVKPVGVTDKCGCGATGCLEAAAGGRALSKKARAMGVGTHAGDLDSSVEALSDDEAKNWHRLVLSATGNVILSAAGFLGESIANMCTLLNPSCLIIGGTVWEGCPNYKKVCLATIEKKTNAPAYEAMIIKDSELGDGAGIIGASTLR